MNINLLKLLNNEIPQIHQPSLSEQLKAFGKLQYTKYNDGGTHFNLLDCKDDVDLEAVKNIILNHNATQGELEEYNNKIIEQRKQRYVNEVDLYKLEALEDDLSGAEKALLKQTAKDNKLKIKQELPKKEIK